MNRSKLPAGLATLSILLAACGATSTGPAAAGCTNLNALRTGGGSAGSAAVTSRQPVAAQVVNRLPNAAGTVIKIGSIGPLTGDQQAIGVDEKNGVQLAVNEANAAGFTAGGKSYTLQVDAKDDQHDPQLAVTGAQQLVDDKVVAVVGHLNSGASIPASAIYHDHGLTQISPSATNPKLTHQGFNNVFRVVGQDISQGKADADFMVKTLGCKKVGIVDDKTAYGQGLADYVNNGVTADGATVVGREHTTDKDTDFTAQLTSLKGKSPDIIFFGGIYPQGGPMAAQIKTLGMTNVPLVGGDGIHSSKFLDLAGDNKDGNYASDAGPDNTLIAGFADFNSRYKAAFGQDVVQYAPEAYDAANIIINAIKTAGGPDTAKIRDAVAATKDYKGVVQTYTFDANGDILNAVWTLYKSVSGKWKALKTVAA
jgi:branched-chain amino acid transport system substrate-binding protein